MSMTNLSSSSSSISSTAGRSGKFINRSAYAVLFVNPALDSLYEVSLVTIGLVFRGYDLAASLGWREFVIPAGLCPGGTAQPVARRQPGRVGRAGSPEPGNVVGY